MRVLILGGTRFIGPPVVRCLVAQGHSVTVFHRGLSTTQLPLGVESVFGDRRELDRFRPIFKAIAPDVVLDMNAMCEQDALDATRVLSGIAGRFIAVSSVDVYQAYGVLLGLEESPPEPVPLVEDSCLRTHLYPRRTPDTKPEDFAYGYDKIPMEGVVLTQPDLPGTVIRLPMVYGSGDFRHRFYPFLKRVDGGRAGIVLPESIAKWVGCWGYVENVALAIALTVMDERAAGRVYHIADAEPINELERLKRLAAVVGWSGRFIVVPDALLPDWSPPINFAQHWTVDSTRIRQELGYTEAMNMQESLKRTVAWQRANPPSNLELATSDFLLDESLEDLWLST
ncbi:MAG: NAD-dependent epimerase/dehydratase family protein [Anaerolineae bacterium]|nr:NAD-dependent epimerase/dehydratase family protein [Gloeobacterales cyanobacterium ES-bin-313]